ncbi:hypothetical protein [Lentilitoribacter sp. EG35]|uniref:hypothetical protein n=1 Tax=Lentilitoribacter sp. EG35 TaxID=3234192 RepID=UPI00345FD854
MSNMIVSWDLNGSSPSHAEMDKYIGNITADAKRVLETVWWVKYHGTAEQLRDRILSLVSNNDRLLVIEAKDGAWYNVLVANNDLANSWNKVF